MDFNDYYKKIENNMINHFQGSIPSTIVMDKQYIMALYEQGFSVEDVAENIRGMAQDKALAYNRRKLREYHKKEYRLALRDNPALTKEEWAREFLENF